MCIPRYALLLLVAVLALGSLGACTTDAPPPRAFAEMRFTAQPPLVFGTQGPEVVSNFRAPLADPHVEHLMPVTPEKAIRTWAADRLQTTGVGSDTLRVMIDDASVIETPLDTEGGVRGFFTDQQDIRYEARAVVAVQIVDARGQVRAEANTTVQRVRTLSEKASLAEREQMWFELVERLMQDVDSQLSSGIRRYFQDHLVAN